MTPSYFPPPGQYLPSPGAPGEMGDHHAPGRNGQQPLRHAPPLPPRPRDTVQQTQTTARRERDRLMRQIEHERRPTPPGLPAGIFAPAPFTAHERDELHLGPLPLDAPLQRQDTEWSTASSASGQTYARSDSWATMSRAPTFDSMTSIDSAAPRLSARATGIEAFAYADHSGNPALAEPQLAFQGNSRRLTPACRQALQQQYQQLLGLKREAERHLLAVESDEGLRAELAELGLDQASLEESLYSLSNRCEEQMTAISMRRAQSQIPVENNPTAQWVAHQMMHSPASRDELNRYLQERRPLELQIKRNQLAQLSAEMARIPSERIAPGPHPRRQELSAKMEALYAQIDQLEQSVGHLPSPRHETATEMTQEAVARYMRDKYEPLRGCLHAMRNDVEQLRHQGQASPAELQQLGIFARALQATLDSAKEVEYGRTWLAIEQAHAQGHPLRIDYSPEAAVSLDTRIGFYGAMSSRPLEPDFPHAQRRRHDDARQRHAVANAAYLQQLDVQQRTGATIHPSVSANREAARSALQSAARADEAARAQYRQEHLQWQAADAAALKYQALKTLAESAQRDMLDDKVGSLMAQGYRALADAPAPKPQAGEIDRLRNIYHDRRQSLLASGRRADAMQVAELEARLDFLARA